MTSTESTYPVREILQRFFPEYLRLHPDLPKKQKQTANLIMKCKTGNCQKSKNLKRIHQLRGSVCPENRYRNMKVAELFLCLYHKDICLCLECSGQMLKLPRGMPASELPPHLQRKLRAVC